MFCWALLYVHSSFTIILMGKRELVALLSLSSLCLVIAVWLFLSVLWGCLQFVIVVFPDPSYLLFLKFRDMLFQWNSVVFSDHIHLFFSVRLLYLLNINIFLAKLSFSIDN